MSRPLLLGVIQLVISAAIAIGSLALFWSSYERWSGIAHLNAANSLALAGAKDSALREARDAAQSLPAEAAAVLPTIDLSSDDAEARLQRLAGICPHNQLPVVTAAQALNQVLHGQEAPALDGADGILLALTAHLRAGTPPSALPEMKDQGGAHLSVLEAFFLSQWLGAFATKQWTLAREAAGTLCLLMPTHPDSPMLAVTAVMLASDFDAERLRRAYKAGPDRARQLAFAQQLAMISPEHADALMSCILGLNLTTAPVPLLEAEISAIGDQGLSAAWVLHECLRSGHPELAAKVVELLPESQRQAEQTRLSNRAGDLSVLVALGAADPTLAPHCSQPYARSQCISFLVSNQQGMLPQAHLVITINGKPVPAADIRRAGPLFGVRCQRTGDFKFEVKGGDQVLYSGTLTL